MKLRRMWVGPLIALCLSTIVLNCYRPNIAQGGFTCATGGVCPDGFHCLATNNRCYQGDAGPEAPTCSAPLPATTCATGPATGQTCNPTCQMGCLCGFCAVTAGATKCVTTAAGNSGIGEICDPRGEVPCKEGLFCKPECNSTDPSLGRCYKFCAVAADCQICNGDGSCQTTTCTVNGASSAPNGGTPLAFKLCSLPAQQCDPIGTTTSGCPATNPAAFACYADSDRTFCDCQGTQAANSTTCRFVGECIPGYTCVILIPGGTTGSCLRACQSNADCTLPTTCNFVPGDSVYGYCL
jgi:hypothetical protein